MERITPEPGDTPGSLARHYLAQRGIASATIETFKIHIDTEPTSTRFKDRLGFRALLEGRLDNLAKEVIWFPCCDSAGNTLNRQGGAFPFIPSETWAAASKSHKPLVIAEGPVKALALAQAGQLAIGVSGVWMATQKESNQHIELVPGIKVSVTSRTRKDTGDNEGQIEPELQN